MAKPIVVIEIPQTKETANVSGLQKYLEEIALKGEYHVLLSVSSAHKKIKYLCLNDNKGLSDVDIESMIKEYTKKIDINEKIEALILNKGVEA